MKATSNRKPGVLVIDGEIQRHPDGSMVDICEYRNCRKPCERGWVKCNQHRNQGVPNWKCRGCGKFSIKAERGVQVCPYCKHGAWIV